MVEKLISLGADVNAVNEVSVNCKCDYSKCLICVHIIQYSSTDLLTQA